MRARRKVAALAGVVALAGAACSSGDGDGGASGATTPLAPDTTLAVEAHDVFFEPDELTAPAGAIEITITQKGSAPHTLVFEGVSDRFMVEVTAPGETDSGVIELDAGTYAFYCDVPGHRQAGMEGVLTVT